MGALRGGEGNNNCGVERPSPLTQPELQVPKMWPLFCNVNSSELEGILTKGFVVRRLCFERALPSYLPPFFLSSFPSEGKGGESSHGWEAPWSSKEHYKLPKTDGLPRVCALS